MDLDAETYVNASRDWLVRESNGDLELTVNKEKNRVEFAEETEQRVTIRIVKK